MSKADAVIVDKVGAEKIEGIGNTVSSPNFCQLLSTFPYIYNIYIEQ